MPQMATLFKASMAAAGIDMSREGRRHPAVGGAALQGEHRRQLLGPPARVDDGAVHGADRRSVERGSPVRPEDRQLDQGGRASTSRAKQIEIYGELGRRYADETACIWPFYSTKLWPYKKRLKGLTLNPTDLVDFRRATLG